MSKRDDILKTAVSLFVEQGIENTPTSQICKESGVATGTLFHHFCSKEQLLKALVLETKESLYESVQAGLGRLPADASREAWHRTIWEAYICWAIANPEIFRFKGQMDALVQKCPEIQEQLSAMWADVRAVVFEGIANGELRPFPDEYIFMLLDASVVSAARYFTDNPNAYADAKVKDVLFAAHWAAISS